MRQGEDGDEYIVIEAGEADIYVASSSEVRVMQPLRSYWQRTEWAGSMANCFSIPLYRLGEARWSLLDNLESPLVRCTTCPQMRALHLPHVDRCNRRTLVVR